MLNCLQLGNSIASPFETKVIQSELKWYNKQAWSYLFVARASFFLVPSRKQDKPQHEKHANIALYSFYWQKIVENMEYFSFCTLISSIMNCWIGANHVKVFYGVWFPENIKGETKLNQSTLKAFCICIGTWNCFFTHFRYKIWLRQIVINVAIVILRDVPIVVFTTQAHYQRNY